MVWKLELLKKLHRKSADVPNVYFSLLDSPGMSPTLVLNQNAQTKPKGKLAFIQNLNGRNCKGYTLKVLMFLDLCAFCQRLAICQHQW